MIEGKASRIPGCQRIVKRLRAVVKVLRLLRIIVGRAQGTRDTRADQKSWLQRVADWLDGAILELDILIAVGTELPGAFAVEARDKRIARKREARDVVSCEDRWSAGLYER
jgi:hypothetical protein